MVSRAMRTFISSGSESPDCPHNTLNTVPWLAFFAGRMV
jgi:hypothetical protein